MCTILRLLKALQCCSAVEESLVYSQEWEDTDLIACIIAGFVRVFSLVLLLHHSHPLSPCSIHHRLHITYAPMGHSKLTLHNRESFNLSKAPDFHDIVSETDCAITSNGFFILASRLYPHIYAHLLAASMADDKVTMLAARCLIATRCTTIWCWSVTLLWHQSHAP
jgi:hypothetical protein